MAAHSVDPKSYTVNSVFPVEGVGELIVFESYVLPGTVHEEISGREVFLFNADGAAIWQIDPETGATENRLHDFDRSIETTEPFVNVWNAYGEYYASRINGGSSRLELASRINGGSSRLELASGLATYSGWART